MYELDYTYRGYMIRKPNPHGKFYLYVSGYYKGKYKWTTDFTYAKHYSLKTAKKHLNNLEIENMKEIEKQEAKAIEARKANPCCINCSHYYTDYGMPCCFKHDMPMEDENNDHCDDFIV